MPPENRSREVLRGRRVRLVGAVAVHVIFAAVVTWPLLRDMSTHVAGDQGDPILNTAILVWNATTLPFSEQWWNAPHYFPTQGVTTFTENLLGVYPISSPIYWLTANPVLAYNVALFLTWPLSGLAIFLLVRRLTDHDAAAFLAGLMFAFNPMRGVAVFHIQTLATYGIPFGLVGLHGYLADQRRGWLVLFGLAWIQQGFANGYYILYGGLIFGLWLLYYCSTRSAFRHAGAILVAWAVSSLALVPMLLRYRAVHDVMGMHRSINEILYFSASPHSWFEVGDITWLWHWVLPSGKDNLFPGLMIVALTVAGIGHALTRGREPSSSHWLHGRLRSVLWAVAAVSVASIVWVLWSGPVDTMVGPIAVKMRSLDRGLVVLALDGVLLAVSTSSIRRAVSSRSHLIFYSAGILVFAILACGPILRVDERPILDPAPYGWLMLLPGFNELRVPTQIKMIHLVCLAVAAGLSFARISPQRTRKGLVACGLCALAIAMEGWFTAMPLDNSVPLWSVVEPSDRSEPILELPLGPGFDGAPTLRASVHHRRVMNGVSGYDPPYYVALKAGLAAHDPDLLAAIGSIGPIDIVVDGSADPDGAHLRYAASAAGAERVGTDGVRTVFRVPRAAAPSELGQALHIMGVQAVRNAATSSLMIDGDRATGWGDYPQRPDGWVIATLASPQPVAGVATSIGDFLLDFPRRLAIDTSIDNETWEPAWEGPTFGHTFLGFIRAPRDAELRFSFSPREARFVRLRQLDTSTTMWRISELTIHAPVSR